MAFSPKPYILILCAVLFYGQTSAGLAENSFMLSYNDTISVEFDADDSESGELGIDIEEQSDYSPQNNYKQSGQTNVVEEVVIGNEGFAQVDSRTHSKLNEARALAKRGASVFFVGLGLEYAIATPLAFVAANNQDVSIVLVSMGLALVATGMKISGPIRNGVGASIAYDESRAAGLSIDRNTNWGFYKTGWVFRAIATGINTINNITVQAGEMPNFSLMFVSLGLGIAADAMWITSCANSLVYTRKVMNRTGISQIRIFPYYTINGQPGFMVSFPY